VAHLLGRPEMTAFCLFQALSLDISLALDSSRGSQGEVNPLTVSTVSLASTNRSDDSKRFVSSYVEKPLKRLHWSEGLPNPSIN